MEQGRWVELVGLLIAATLPAFAALRWLFRLEARVISSEREADSRVSAHENICEERYRNLAERHTEVLRMLELMRGDMHQSAQRIHERLDLLPVKPWH